MQRVVGTGTRGLREARACRVPVEGCMQHNRIYDLVLDALGGVVMPESM